MADDQQSDDRSTNLGTKGTLDSKDKASQGAQESVDQPASEQGSMIQRKVGSQPPWLMVLLLFGIFYLLFLLLFQEPTRIEYSDFLTQLEQGNVHRVLVSDRILQGEFHSARTITRKFYVDEEGTEPEIKRVDLPRVFSVNLGPRSIESLEKKLQEKGVDYDYELPFDYGMFFTAIWFLLLIGLAIFMWGFMRRTREQFMGGGMLGGVTKSTAKRYEAENGPQKTFDDVAGLKGVKKDLKEIVDFLREPERFQRLGARVPKGVLLNGPPGTGKTLLAKAIAGEAGVPFYSINGSEFIQLFVGVGASRVRDMFETAKRTAPSILFIDEIDAVGRQRGAGLGGGHDEREQTLNQILSEMDGFTESETVIVIAATNRPDVLDPALLRPGRFDRHITVDRPTIEGREELLEVHSQGIPIADTVDFAKLAKATVGMTGADIMNLVNEAALWATRNDKKAVDEEDFEYARDKILMGDTREDILNEKEKRLTAYHEAGHALLGWLVPSVNQVHKVTIIPRGRALGVTQYVPEEDRHNMTESEMRAQLAMMLAGREAEDLIFHEYSAGAENDLKRATDLARRMVTHWGMSDRVGPVAYHTNNNDPFLGREIVQEHRNFSEHTAQIIDEEVAKLLNNSSQLAKQTLTEHRDKLEAITSALLEHEEIDDDDLTQLIGPRVAQEDSPLAPMGPESAAPNVDS